MTEVQANARRAALHIAAVAAGPLFALMISLTPAPSGLDQVAWNLVGVKVWMVIWWITEAVPLPATALIPIPIMPLLGIGSVKSVAEHYAHPIIFLFLGGFMLASALEKSGLHKRIALSIVVWVGKSAVRIIGGFMLAMALLSMWISNTATALLTYAEGISVIQTVENQIQDPDKVKEFGIALMLSIAYSASIGGGGTLIGTPPNALLASTLENSYQIEISFLTWMMFGIPLVIVLLPITWIILTRLMFPISSLDLFDASGVVKEELERLGPPSRNEIWVVTIFLFAAFGWIFGRSFSEVTGLPVTDTTVALMAALLLYAVPLSVKSPEFLLDWDTVRRLPWGVLLIFGGGLAIASAFTTTGLAEAIGNNMKQLGDLNIWFLVLLSSALIIALTEVTSNTASAATFLPIFGAIAVGIGYDPLILTIPIALGASMAFMMPVATPPKAIVYSYEKLHISDMARFGFWMNLLAVLVCFAAVYFWSGFVFGLSFA